ncbi:hypothetical protein MO973_43280 [Paenibacillus sp. TRM 82003]|nr:hypothetical protein [Paenibacillus sp. TRM 82003]
MKDENATTRNLLFFCYTCPDLRRCETLEKCEACWSETEAALAAEAEAEAVSDAEPDSTEALLRAYYA